MSKQIGRQQSRMPQRIVLHVEDEGEDAFFVRWAFQKAGINCTVLRLRSGQECIDYLKGSGRFFERTVHPVPDLVLLDLKLPQLDGYQVLDWIRAQDEYRGLPVAVVTGCADPGEIDKASARGATCCFEKSPHYASVVEYVSGLFQTKPTEPLTCPGPVLQSAS